jgi:DUF971 family protein
MPGPATQPVDIELDRSKELRIRWADGQLCVYPLALLRRACPCAACRTERERLTAGGGLPVVREIQAQRDMAYAETVELIGQYALRLTWKDGHDAGIYDYELLRSLCPA